MVQDGLEYFKNIRSEMSKMNRTIRTRIEVDATPIVNEVERRLKSGLSRRTMEASGVFGI